MPRRRARVREEGAAIVELAFILPLLALLVFGTVDLVRAYRLDVRLEAAAREGATFSQIYPNEVDCPDAMEDLHQRVALEDPDLDGHPGFSIRAMRRNPLAPLGDPYVEYDTCESDGGPEVVKAGERVRVDVSATFDVLTPLVEIVVGQTIEMTSSAEVETQG